MQFLWKGSLESNTNTIIKKSNTIAYCTSEDCQQFYESYGGEELTLQKSHLMYSKYF